ncbi:MAG TPA: LytTR family DNA-binding domain-containing protein [Flavisolibacter sp.]
MINTIIIEDDPISAELLSTTLMELRPDIEVKAVLGSVTMAIDYLKNKHDTHLLFSDIQLPDGLSFSIYEKVTVTCPIIFVSAYDKYMLNVFDYCGIDYLLKPVSHRDVNQALNKYDLLQNHFATNNHVNSGIKEYLKNKRSRILLRKGSMLVSMPLEEIVLFYTENMVVFALDQCGNKYMADKSLNVLEEELDPVIFMRVNRQYILNVKYVYGFKIYDRVKLMVSLTQKDIDHVIIVGQEKAKMFREWICR